MSERCQAIYVISSDSERVKIGISLKPASRLRALQTASHLVLKLEFEQKLARGRARLVEQRVHQALQNCRQKGEWFFVSAQRAIQTVNDAIDDDDRVENSDSEQQLKQTAAKIEIDHPEDLRQILHTSLPIWSKSPSTDEIRARLKFECANCGGQSAWARRHGLAAAYVSDVVHGRRDPGNAILQVFGLKRVFLYEEVA